MRSWPTWAARSPARSDRLKTPTVSRPPLAVAPGRPCRRRRAPRCSGLLVWGVLLALLAASWKGADLRPLELIGSSGNMAQFAPGSFRRNFADWRSDLSEMIVTLRDRAVGHGAGGASARCRWRLLASANLAPWWIHQPVRRVLDAFRAINEMVFALLFVSAVGLGPVRRRAGAVGAHDRRAGQAVRRGRRGDRPAAGRRHPRHRRAPAQRDPVRRDPAGRAAVGVVHAVSLRVERALGRRSSASWARAASARCCGT